MLILSKKCDAKTHCTPIFLGLPQNLWVRMYSCAPDYAEEICVYE